MTTDLGAGTSGFKDPSRYHRTGVVFAQDLGGTSEKLSMQLPADKVDWLERTLKSLRPNQQWVQQEPAAMLAELRQLAIESAPYLCRLVTNIDLVLARWSREELDRFWTAFSQLAKNAPHPVILLLPERAGFLGPQGSTLAALQKDGRVVHL